MVLLACFAVFMQSCVSSKKISYFNYVSDSASFMRPMTINMPNFVDPKIQVSDILQVTVQTLDPSSMVGSTRIGIDQPNSFSTKGTESPSTIVGYMVNSDGEIELPLVGRVRVVGLTTKEAKSVLSTKAQVYYKNPVVNVRLANFVITMLGDVTRPGQYTIPNEKLTILEALSLAGDISVTGQKENIIIGREENGEKKYVRINLNSTDFYNSPYYYLKQHDIIYVPPTKNKAVASDARTTRTLTILTATISMFAFAVSAASLLRK
ncbi:MAG TPA: polysaccharide biosynthesis/export family protein [Flavipsychrobacter sp.]|nr:polysaccharide biosynthesis/export family protein [Flavipsychrobacter sp.]